MSDDAVQLELLRYEDSAMLGNVFSQLNVSLGGGGLTPFSNPITGVGTGRDPSQYFQVNEPYILNHDERLGLIEGSRIAQNIVSIYPNEASWGVFAYKGNRYSKNPNSDINNYFDNFRLGSLQKEFIAASIEARVHGESFLLLGVDDGRDFEKPINFNNIRSFNWAKTYAYYDVELDRKQPNIFHVTIGGLTVEESNETRIKKEVKKLKVHKDRLLKFVGDPSPISLYKKRGMHGSSLQCAYDGFALAMQGMLNANAMLTDHSLFWYKLDGLAQLIRQKKFDEIYTRFLTLQMSKSVIKGMAMDAKNEDVGFINRNYGGVKDILELLTDYMVAETGMVRYKVLGTASRAGLGAEGRGLQDRLEHSLKIKSWQGSIWRDHLLYCAKLGLLAKDGVTRGKLPYDLSLSFPPVIELTPLEIAELRERNLNWAEKAIANKLLDPLEARLGIFSSPDNMILPVINLDNRITEILDSELEARLDPDLDEEGQQKIIPSSLNHIDPDLEDDDNEDRDVIQTFIDNGKFDSTDKPSFSKWVSTNLDSLETQLSIELVNKADSIEYDEVKKKWVLYDSQRSRILGRFKTEAEAKRREKQVNFFKYLKRHPSAKKIVEVAYKDSVEAIKLVDGKVNKQSIMELLRTKLKLSENDIEIVLQTL